MSKKKVIILGGGVAGMSAAHELIERGFEVQVFERKISLPGGKARSVPVPDPDAGPHYNPLPGEHGFRFFPGFYRHVIDTMKRIPFPGNKNGVLDNLVPAPKAMLARMGYPPTVILDRFPQSWDDFKFLLSSLHLPEGLPKEDADFFGLKVWQLMTSCKSRRENDYERMGWWQFTEAENRSKAYQSLLAGGLTRTLVAARAQTASTKTGGDIFLQLLFNMANPDIPTDRILNGPTNQQWLFPWHQYLVDKGVDYRFLSDVKKLECVDGKITGVWIEKEDPNTVSPDAVGVDADKKWEKFTADYYICAVPIEVAAPLIIEDLLGLNGTVLGLVDKVIKNTDLTDPSISVEDVVNNELEKAAIIKADPTLVGMIKLSYDVSWMTGVQYYLNEVVTLNHGHIIFADSPWAVTAISQSQFWPNFPMSEFADGKVKTVLSCDVSNWDQPGILLWPKDDDTAADPVTENGVYKIAKKCTPEQIKKEVWAQMKKSLVVDGKSMLSDEMIHTWFIDRDIKFEGDYFSKNNEPLLVNKVDTWRLRPCSYCAIPNLFFAADYVRTHTDLATMEGANEAARRAVNNILEASGDDSTPCEIWDLHEPWLFAHLRNHDKKRYLNGLVWNAQFPWWVRLFQWILSLFKKGAQKSSA
ncbi:MAG: FAD-dependent oxidoreductase [Bacteroidetes bacterium]|nr:FAD-dependent oxidoreductase [Bacteroidota bacterium]